MTSPFLNRHCRSYAAALQDRLALADREDRIDHNAERELARIETRRYQKMASRRLAERIAANCPR